MVVPPAFVKPMECTPVDDVPDDPERFVYEVKLDGDRCCGVLLKHRFNRVEEFVIGGYLPEDERRSPPSCVLQSVI